MSTNNAPGVGPGHNVGQDWAAEESARLNQDYGHTLITTRALVEELKTIPSKLEKTDLPKVGNLMQRVRDHVKALNDTQGVEKAPHLRRGEAVDQFFYGQVDVLAKRSRGARDGVNNVLQRLLDDLTARLDAEERARREEEARKRRAEEERLRLEAEEQKRLADEAAAAAERARKPENIAAHEERAAEHEHQALQAGFMAEAAAGAAEEAAVNTQRPLADRVRERLDGGSLFTGQEEKYAEVTDRDKLDHAKLWPYLKLEALQFALTQYAKATDYREPMDGAAIGRRPKGRLR